MPLLVALRLDGTIDASWPVVFVPFWIVDFVFLWILAYVRSSTYASVGMNSCMTLFNFFLIFASIVGFQIMICMDEDDPFIKDNYLVAIVPILLASCALCVAFTSCCLENSANVLTVASFLWYVVFERGVREWCSRAKRENFNHFTISCFDYVTRISCASINHSENQRSNANSIMTNTGTTQQEYGYEP